MVKWHEHAKVDMEIEHGHVAWTYSMDMQIGDMGMQPCGQSSKNSGTALADYFFTVNLQTHEKIMRNCSYAVAEQHFIKKIRT
jgi:hypothetical protein